MKGQMIDKKRDNSRKLKVGFTQKVRSFFRLYLPNRLCHAKNDVSRLLKRPKATQLTILETFHITLRTFESSHC